MKGVDSLYGRWNILLTESNPKTVEEFEWTTNQLKGAVEDVRDDLDDLEETIEVKVNFSTSFFFVLL